ncbi:bromo adjacent homology domain-containing 1 protein [Nerophis lumbriciformis]|uniref:bromo adjacent homology domain-containing 1 protein n=1 Tax=Nerophis lumbriciformis TaxID=546530 RepID=UPI002ADFE608|nr:bromo adjacent homology domain-containing 1 protein-like [Nerophis lumbriciformis]XP_061785380.1 bromo adjacent homology domain-containing 1 protein-like [Nerophis lumbriciformis]
MTHIKQKGSNQRWDRSPPWSHGGAMGVDQLERSLRFGRTKKISEVVYRRKVKKDKKDAERSNQTQKPGCEKKRDRKLYPLRGRVGDGLSCHVLLTRLEENIRRGKKAVVSDKDKTRKSGIGASTKTKSTSKVKSKLSDLVHVLQPRKRRLASLNAEAVNSLLLERATDLQPPAKQAKRQEEPTNGAHTTDEHPESRTATAAALKTSQRNVSKTSLCSISKKVKKKTSRGHKSQGLSLEILDTPTPRRLAGLNAAALLKLTSLSAVTKHRVKAAPSTTLTSDGKNPAAIQKQTSRVKHKGHSQKQKGGLVKMSPMHCSCSACKKADFEPKVEWESSSVAKPGYQSRSMLDYTLKNVKEEQLETELNPCYCCPPEGSVEYCHRLAFFLSQQPFAESGDQSISSAVTPVKRECLVTSSSLTHSHPALTLSHHPCLCYYVHIAPHLPQTGTSPLPPLTSRPLSFAPPGLCPNRTIGSKPPGPQVTHASPVPHPAYCNSVGSPCYGEACGIGGYACRTVAPVNSRGCSFSAGCTGCSHGIKTETFSSSQGDHSPSLLVPPPISSCPLSSVPTSTQTNPHLLTPLLGQEQQPRARLKAATDRPQGTKASLDSVPPTLQQRPPSPPSPCKQKKVVRRRATNGWRSVGIPAEKDIFIVGEDETALRLCYEGVEREGEVIRVRDTVLLRSGPRKKSLPYVAKISALWEDPKTGELMMSLFWYYRPEHTQGGRDPSMHCENEIFASRHQDENSVACIEDRCYVLPLAQYCRYCALIKQRSEGAPPGRPSTVPPCPDFAPPSHRCVPADVDPELVYLCRHVYDFRYGRILKNLQ